MARLFTGGMEANSYLREGFQSFIEDTTLSTTRARTGAKSLRCNTGNNTFPAYAVYTLPGTRINLFARAYAYIESYPVAYMPLIQFYTAGYTNQYAFTVSSTGEVGYAATNGMTSYYAAGTAPGVVPINEWVRLEFNISRNSTLNIDSWECRVNGKTVYTDSRTMITSDQFAIFVLGMTQQLSVGANRVVYFDDVAINDLQGTEQNSWPGEGRVALLEPVSDNFRGAGWFRGSTDTDNLWQNLVLTASGSVLNDGRNTTKYRPNLQTYASQGITSEAKITVLNPFFTGFEPQDTGAKPLRLSHDFNPSTADGIVFTPVGTATQYFGMHLTDPTLLNSIVKTDNPVPSIQRWNDNNENVRISAFAMYVEYKLPQTTSIGLSAEGVLNLTPRRERTTSQALSASSTLSSLASRQRGFEIAYAGNLLFSSTSNRERTSTLPFTDDVSTILENIRERQADISLLAESHLDMLSGAIRPSTINFSSNAILTLTSDVSTTHLGQLELDTTFMYQLSAALDRQAEIHLSGEGDTLLVSVVERTDGMHTSGNIDATLDASRERESYLDFETSASWQAFSGALRNAALLLSGNAFFNISSDIGRTLFGELSVDAEGTIILSSVAERTTPLHLMDDIAFNAEVIRERLAHLDTSALFDLIAASGVTRVTGIDLDGTFYLVAASDTGTTLLAEIAFVTSSALEMGLERIRIAANEFSIHSNVTLYGGVEQVAEAAYSALWDASFDGDRLRTASLGMTAEVLAELAALRDMQGELILSANTDFHLAIAREIASQLALDANFNLTLGSHAIEHIPAVEYFFRTIPNQVYFVPQKVLYDLQARQKLNWFNAQRIRKNLIRVGGLYFFIKRDWDDRLRR